MTDQPEAGPSSRPASTSMSRRRSSSTRSTRTRTSARPRVASSTSQHSDLTSGLSTLNWTTGDSFDYTQSETSISAFLICPICLGPFLDPHASTRCSHTFCKECITTALAPSASDDPSHHRDQDPLIAAARSRCPTCRAPVVLSDIAPTALLIKNIVDTLQVYCPNKSKGCTHQCERHLLRSHVATECAFEYVDQNLAEGRRCGCKAKVMRKDWANHNSICPKRKLSCPACDLEFCADEMEHHSERCSPEPATCEYCKYETIKSRLSGHLERECEEIPVTCSHSGFGCGWSGPRRLLQQSEHTAAGKRREEKTHLEEECRYEPLSAFFNVFTSTIDTLTEHNIALRTRLEDLETRQQGQARRVDDVVHSLGPWYRSAGDIRNSGGAEERVRGSQAGVDGEWDEFPLDSGNWEGSLSQSSFRQARAHSAGALGSGGVDLATWARRQYSNLSPEEVLHPARSNRSGSSNPAVFIEDASPRRLAPPTARSMPSSISPLGANLTHASSASRERGSYLGIDATINGPVRSGSATMLSPIQPSSATLAISPGNYASPSTLLADSDPLDRTTLDSALLSLTSAIHGLSTGLSTLDKRTEEGHIAALKAGFDAGRVQEEVASLRHGLHAVRMQIHQLLMREQRQVLFGGAASPGLGNMSAGVAGANTAEAGSSVSVSVPAGLRETMMSTGMPVLSPPLLRRWAGLEHTKL
ncbi:uncharacterized protein MEPE_04201 [Melanopsichium pennsylvanicum]|uniref:Uncharacterized protein n=2 Tax=Melanopsichium pennsylvanicum TaxID=63383 RepID=A0AAJ4XNJ7_9BASI|nr:tnf receptor-associated factor [Melanopsichium pennsylvanicum 4]SNX85492.1 uncharacterized protein MEPE_04201 [Melanopsichium pennsylvanicum]